MPIGQSGVSKRVTDSVTKLVAIGLNLVILLALPLAIIGAFVALAVIGHATTIITGSAVSLQATVLPVAVSSPRACRSPTRWAVGTTAWPSWPR